MRIATGFAASASVLIAARALGLVGPWGLAAGAVLLLLAAVVAVTVMESRDLNTQAEEERRAGQGVLRRAAWSSPATDT